jgi:hypothetical protein
MSVAARRPRRPTTLLDERLRRADADRCGADQHGTMQIQWRPIRGVHVQRASPAMPKRVPAAAVTHAGDVADEDLARTEAMPDRAVCRGERDPAAAVVLDEVADHGLTVARLGPSPTLPVAGRTHLRVPRSISRRIEESVENVARISSQPQPRCGSEKGNTDDHHRIRQPATI